MTLATASARPLILAINPSHATDVETEFWSAIAAAAAEEEWQLVQVAARAIPGVERAVTDVFTARLWQYAERMTHRDPVELRTLPPWIDNSAIERHTAWEHMRWEIGSFDPAVVDGAHRLAWYIDDLIRWLRPAVVLTTNKIDHPCAFARACSLHYGIKTMLIERSPFDGIWLEPNGLFAESDLWTAAPGAELASYQAAGAAAVAGLVANPAGFRTDEASTDRPNLDRAADGPLVFLPMDNLLWTGWGQAGHPQGETDNPRFATPQDGIAAVADWAARRNGHVALKAHPSCVLTPKLTLPANVELVDGDLAHFLDRADLTVTFNTKLAFLAAAQGKRLAVLADNPAAVAPSVPFWRRTQSIGDLLDLAVDGPPPNPEDIVPLFGWMESEHFYTIQAGERGPARLVSDLIESVPPPGGRVLDLADSEKLARRSRGVPSEQRPASTRHRVIIDVTRLANPRGRHSGIGRYCDEILDSVVQDADAEVWALVREPARGWPASAIDLHFELRRRVAGRVLSIKNGATERTIERTLGPLGPQDVFHSTHLGLPDQSLLGEAARVVTIHDVLHVKYPDLYNGPRPPTIKRILDTIDRDEDWVSTVSDQTRRDLLSVLPKTAGRIRVIPLGVGLPEPTDEEREGFVLAMLQGEPRKNLANTVDAIGRALRALRDETTQVVFVVNRATLRPAMDAAAAAKLGKQVRFVTSPSDAELGDLYSGANLYVFGSIYEGFGLPPLEALSFGTPTVAVMASSMLEVLGDAVVYATSGKAEDLAAAIVSVLRSPHLRASLAERGRERARGYTWAKTAARHIDVYKEAALGVEA